MSPYGYASAVKQKPDNVSATLAPLVVTAGTDQLGGAFYLENPDRTAGIRVDTSQSIGMGSIAVVSGVLETTSTGERGIKASSVRVTGSGTVPPPLLMQNKFIGGGGWNYNQSTGIGQIGIDGAAGLNNCGLLVKTTGRVQSADPGSSRFTIGDGSGVQLDVLVPNGIGLPTVGQYVGVTGISSCETIDGLPGRELLARTADDIQAVDTLASSGTNQNAWQGELSYAAVLLEQPSALDQPIGALVEIKGAYARGVLPDRVEVGECWNVLAPSIEIMVPGLLHHRTRSISSAV